MKTIKIFIASSAELKEDRDRIRIFTSQENDRLHATGIYLELVQCESFLDAMSNTSLQDEYNNAISECDIFLCLFFTKVGKYTAGEFETAYQVFKDNGKPKIWTYFKNAQIDTGSITDEIHSLLTFKKKIADLGHFLTEYNNIDNLTNKYRSQLDKFLQHFEKHSDKEAARIINRDSPGATGETVKNTFNEILTKRLIEAIRPCNKKACEFLASNGNWQANTNLVPTVKHIIISGYVGVIGMQLRKLMSIGEEAFSNSKMKRYLENCLLTAKRGLQLICYALMSRLWDHQLSDKLRLSQTQTNSLIKFFKDAAEENLTGFADLLKTLIEIFSENSLELPFPKLTEIHTNLIAGSGFMNACTKLLAVADLLQNVTYTANDCAHAEEDLTVILENLNFLAEYKMISIKDIGYNKQRNDKQGIYLHNYILLESDSQANNGSQGKIRKENSPIICNAVLLFKENIWQNINMMPFIIDYNALGLAGGSKICFYSFCNTYGDLSLNYNFIEDNSKIIVKKSMNSKPDNNDAPATNKWLSNPDNRKDMNFDNVFHLFNEAKKTLAGLEDETVEDTF